MSIGAQPRVRVATLPTPLQEAKRFREALGGASRSPRILIKRDDLTGLALGGNKARKLEFLVADAVREGATVLVTVGAAQSNHARMTAAAANAAGMRAALVLTSADEHPELQGNLLLDRLLDAELHFIPPSADPTIATSDQEEEKVAEVCAALRARGERPYFVPVGGSNGIGSLGYVLATLELLGQLADMDESPTRLYYAAGSRGTQAGLVLGTKLYGSPYQLCSIAVSGGLQEKAVRAVRIANEAAELIGSSVRVTPADVEVIEGYIGERYGVPTPECLEAISLLARSEGILLDPVYSGKAMAGLIDHIRRGEIDPAESVVFLHTGGTAALFAKVDLLGLEPATAQAATR
jgi:D-cysteine desulfhydrase family pyridoxal phosphate-dependent enzyme